VFEDVVILAILRGDWSEKRDVDQDTKP